MCAYASVKVPELTPHSIRTPITQLFASLRATAGLLVSNVRTLVWRQLGEAVVPLTYLWASMLIALDMPNLARNVAHVVAVQKLALQLATRGSPPALVRLATRRP